MSDECQQFATFVSQALFHERETVWPSNSRELGKKLGNIKVTESLHPSDKLAVLSGLAFGHELAS